MIKSPSNQREWQACAAFLHQYAHVQPTMDARYIAWISEDKLVIVVGFNAWMGSVCQIHLAFAPNWTFPPRQMLHECFRYAFDIAKRKQLIGLVNSKNEKAMRMDLGLGFTEITRLPGMHDDGGDLVVLGMTRAQCRYLEDEPEVVPAAEAVA